MNSIYPHYRRNLALAALLCLAPGCGKSAPPAADKAEAAKTYTVELATAEKRTVEQTIEARGTLSPAQGAVAKVAPTAPAKVRTVLVKEGDRVTVGQPVAILENRVQEQQTASARAALTTAQAQARSAELIAAGSQADHASAVNVARLTLQAATLDRDTAIAQAASAREAAATDLRKTEAGARPQELALAQQAVNQARATRDRATVELNRVKFLVQSGVDSQRQLDDAQTAHQLAEAALASAQQQESLVHAGARQEDVQAARIRLRQADESLRQARTSGDAKIAQAAAGLRQAEQSALTVSAKRQDAVALGEGVRQKQADLQAAQATAALSTLRAPLTGHVTRRMLNPGDVADTTAPVLEISNTRTLNLIANLPADEGARVAAGMPVHLTGAAGHTANGRVLTIGTVDPLTNLMAVRISVPAPTSHMVAGEFVTAYITLRTDRAVPAVPDKAIVSRESKSVIYVVDAQNVAHLHEVTPGPSSGGWTEVGSAANPGDKVVLVGQYELTDGAKVQTASAAEKPAGAKD